MNSKNIFLHDHAEFKTLVEVTAQAEKIVPYLVEKDYWLMHSIWGLQQFQLPFHLKGGTSLSKGYGIIHRFSEDIDVKIEPNEKLCGFKVFIGKNHDDVKHRSSRRDYFNWMRDYLNQNKNLLVPGISNIERDINFDDAVKFRNGGIRFFYKSNFLTSPGVKEGILLEVGFDRTAPNQPCRITSWVYERGSALIKAIDNRAVNVPCYEPQYTFVEKLQAVVRKYRLYKEGSIGNLPANFIRHYYDIYQLIDQPEVQAFIGTLEYENFKIERFGSDDTKISKSDAFQLTSLADRQLFEKEYARSESLYFKGRPSLEKILSRIGKDLNRL